MRVKARDGDDVDDEYEYGVKDFIFIDEFSCYNMCVS
jgi:hypothetical protein